MHRPPEFVKVDNCASFYKLVSLSEPGQVLLSTRGAEVAETYDLFKAFGQWGWVEECDSMEVFFPDGCCVVFDGRRPPAESAKAQIAYAMCLLQKLNLTYTGDCYISILINKVAARILLGQRFGNIQIPPELSRWGHWGDLVLECEDFIGILKDFFSKPPMSVVISFTDKGFSEVCFEVIDEILRSEIMAMSYIRGEEGNGVIGKANEWYKPNFKRLKARHPYKLKSSFTPWEIILADVSGKILYYGDRDSMIAGPLAEWDEFFGPVYCVSDAISNEFLHSEFCLSKIERQTFSDFPATLFAFERGRIMLTCGGHLSFAVVRKARIREADYLQISAFITPKAKTNGAVKHCGMNPIFSLVSLGTPIGELLGDYLPIAPSDGIDFELDSVVSSLNCWSRRPAEASEDLRNIAGIVIQCILCAQHEPSLVSGPEENQASIGQAMKPSKGSKRVLRPRWLGKNYVRPSVRISHGGTHVSPHPHWRKAHWRQQPCGPKGKERKLTLVRSVFVRGQSTLQD